MKTEPRFQNVSRSQCGRDFGAGDHGFSHCSDHAPPFPEGCGATSPASEDSAREMIRLLYSSGALAEGIRKSNHALAIMREARRLAKILEDDRDCAPHLRITMIQTMDAIARQRAKAKAREKQAAEYAAAMHKSDWGIVYR